MIPGRFEGRVWLRGYRLTELQGKPATASQALDLSVQSFSDGVNRGMVMVIRA